MPRLENWTLMSRTGLYKYTPAINWECIRHLRTDKNTGELCNVLDVKSDVNGL